MAGDADWLDMAPDRAQRGTEARARLDAPGLSRVGPIRRIAGAGAMIVILMIVAVGVSVWRSETSATLSRIAIGEERQLATAISGHDLVFDRAGIFTENRPLTASARTALSRAQQKFALTFSTDLTASGQIGPDQRTTLDRVLAANRQLTTLERVIQPLLGRRGSVVARRRLADQQQVVDGQIDSYVGHNALDAEASQTAAQAAHRDSRAVAIAMGGLAVLLALLLVAYMIRLLRSSFGRIRADGELLEAHLRDVELARLETLQRLALAAEYRDDDTMHHTERVGRLAALVADRMGLAPEIIELIRHAAPLHDVGKLGVSDAILLKPGPLTAAEWNLMKRHSTMGAGILAGSKSPVLHLGEEIARSHHERWDGTGYPDGLAREAIPLSARIVAIADTFDALTHERPYKHAWALDDALAEIEQLAWKQFDPRVVNAFLALDYRNTLEPVTGSQPQLAA
jgi:HD-GYP domain-containing protein (c-di-GMP phosphodiesterase class II)